MPVQHAPRLEKPVAEAELPDANWFGRRLRQRFGFVWLAVALAGAVGFLTRLALMVKSGGDVAWNLSLLPAFLIGTVYDLAAALWWATPLAVALAALPRRFFERWWGRALGYALLPAIMFLLLFGTVAEWLFWDEFGARFNFIAVDYLVYTTEVLGNIRESYPMPLIYGGLAVATALGYAAVLRLGWVRQWLDHAATPVRGRWYAAAGWVAALAVAGLGLQQRFIPPFANNYNAELAKSGLWSLFAAFWSNELEYDRFYPTMPDDVAFKRLHALLASDGSRRLTSDSQDLLRLVSRSGPEIYPNVIQITVESLSANFLSAFNRASNLMPNLEGIARESLLFNQFYATGTRTDRGMEALTLSVPPTPGRSLVKRPRNEKLFTLGSVFRSKGYATAFIYGGYGYFDNMNHFFGENGYRLFDRNNAAKSDITFVNAWGACDEDLFGWATREADRDYAAGRPFFHFVMTTSNHRPFTYPEGKIDLSPKTAGRPGAVKYSDYAIGQFLRVAATKPWFKNTIFVIVGDHCASAAGITELPVQNYHIPLLIYAPGGQVKPGVVNTLMSQMDYAPTLLGLLNWTYPSRFFGADVLAPGMENKGRALIGNYQELGLFRAGKLGVLKPVRPANTYSYDRATHKMDRVTPDPALIDDAIVYYQTASRVFKKGSQRELSASEIAEYGARGNATSRVSSAAPALGAR